MICKRISGTRQHGFSLVEIMVAMVLGIVMLLVVSEVFVNNSRTRDEVEKSGRQIENGTYALRLLEDELANAGYWGEAGGQPVAASLPPLCPTAAADISAAMGYPIQGDAGSGSNCAKSKDGSAFLAIRRVSTCAVGDVGCAAASTDFHLQVSACQSESPGTLKLSTNVDALVFKQHDCKATAPRYRFLSRVFYVGDNDILMRAELSSGNYNTVTSLVDDIEIIRFEYGLDINGDAQVDEYTPAPDDTDWPNVVAVKVSLIARNPQATLGYVDERTYMVAGEEYEVPDDRLAFRRQFYSTTVHLRNVAGRRELPAVTTANEESEGTESTEEVPSP
ncbi:type IV pilus assembly protein PilW [Azotobacter beijerinckii]|uniref:Type IV pilus assembly protein PilW n=1 Tax=Azotobacter beijerinckii TaxID=170623 RepID=A0A1H6QZ29_9GAMM|nr:PilW family protein [Azotobacter beijerinckii]SEI48931.1 type IV pilus assembly protein PilW [Azotobacter beijerinckii]